MAVWHLRPEVTIGGAEDGPYSLNDIRGIGLDPQGRIYVLDGQALDVRVFSPDGRHLRTIGRAGAGPGEFQGANGIALDPSGRLWVYDPKARRLTGFDSGGRLSRTVPIPIASRGFLWEGGLDTAGHAYDIQYVRRDTTAIPVLRRIRLVEGRIDTLALPECHVPRPAAFRFPRGYMQVPYSPGLYRWYDLPDQVWCANTGVYEIQSYDLVSHASLRKITATATPTVVTPAERDSAISRVRAFMKDAGTAELDFDLIPPSKPLIQALDRDPAGRLWVRLETAGGPLVEVFGSQATPIARAAVPIRSPGFLHWVIRDSSVLAVALDSLDIPHVVRLRIDRGP